MTIQWFTSKMTIPSVSIASYGFTFNSGSLQFFREIPSVLLGYDSTQKKVYVKLLRDRDETAFSIPELDERTRSIRISCRDFVQFLQVKTKLDFEKPVKYFADWDEESNLLIVDLTAPISSSKAKKDRNSNLKKGD
jgi:hypothetical protein